MAEPTLLLTQAAIASRTAAAGRVNTARSTPSGSSSGLLSTARPSIGSALRPTRWMSPLKLFSLSDWRMTWPALPARADMPTIATDRGRRKRATAPRAACGLRTAHAASLSGWNISRCVPSESGCQNGLTFMPTASSSALQLTMPAITLIPTSSVTLTTA